MNLWFIEINLVINIICVYYIYRLYKKIRKRIVWKIFCHTNGITAICTHIIWCYTQYLCSVRFSILMFELYLLTGFCYSTCFFIPCQTKYFNRNLLLINKLWRLPNVYLNRTVRNTKGLRTTGLQFNNIYSHLYTFSHLQSSPRIKFNEAL